MVIRRVSLATFIDILLVPVLIFFLFFYPNFISGPILGLDEGYHLASINEILEGGIPYRDVYIQHGPLLEYLPVWLMKLFGVHLGVFRGFYLFGNILSCLLSFFLLRTLVSNPALKYSALYLMLRFPMDYRWNSRWGGVRWAPGFVALILIYRWLRDKKPSFLVLAGVACAIGLLTSQEIGFCIGVSAATAILLKSREREPGTGFIRSSIRDGLIFSVGVVIILLPICCYFLYNHALIEYLKINFIDTPFLLTRALPYSQPVLPIRQLFSLSAYSETIALRSLVLYGIVLAFSGILLWSLWKLRKNSDIRLVAFATLVIYGAAALIGTMRNPDGPPFNVFLPIAFIVFASFLQIILDLRPDSTETIQKTSREELPRYGRRLRKVAIIVLVLCALLVTGNPYSFFGDRISAMWSELPSPFFIELDPTLIPRASRVKLPWTQAEDISRCVAFLRNQSNDEDCIYTFPFEGHINFLADRRSASRFNTAIFSRLREEYMHEVVKDLESTRPQFIVYNPNQYKILGIPNEQRLAVVWQYIQNHYESHVRFGDIEILRLSRPPSTRSLSTSDT